MWKCHFVNKESITRLFNPLIYRQTWIKKKNKNIFTNHYWFFIQSTEDYQYIYTGFIQIKCLKFKKKTILIEPKYIINIFFHFAILIAIYNVHINYAMLIRYAVYLICRAIYSWSTKHEQYYIQYKYNKRNKFMEIKGHT